MATMIVQFQVKDFAEWEEIFNDNLEFRKSHGQESEEYYQSADDPNDVTVIFHWDSMEKAKAFSQSPELRAKMQESGVAGPAKVSYLKKA